MKYLLDTDHLSILQWELGEVYDRLSRRIGECDQDDIAVSIVSFHEQALGCNAFLAKAKTAQKVVRGYEMFRDVLDYFSSSQVLSYDKAVANIAVDLKASRVRLGLMDLRIAATALAKDLILLTRNAVDFERVPGLRIEDWTK